MSMIEVPERKLSKVVRNHLFNTLGLTKREIEQMIVKIVGEQVTALIANRGDGLGAYVERCVRIELRRHKDIEKFVADEVKKMVAEHVRDELKDRLSIEIATKPKTS